MTPDDLETLSEEFSVAHEKTFGYRSDDERLQLVSLKVIGRGVPESPRLPGEVTIGGNEQSAEGRRRAYFGPDLGWLETPVTQRPALAGTPRPGPLIVEEYDTTTVVRPGWTAFRDAWNNIVLDRQPD